MPETCIFPLCRTNALRGSEFCVGHNKSFGSKEVKEKKPIAKKSAKRIEEDKVYKKVKKDLPKECKVKSPVCIRETNGHVHHLQKTSPGNRTNKKNLLPCCDPCNGFIEQNSSWAKANGFIVSRFKKEAAK